MRFDFDTFSFLIIFFLVKCREMTSEFSTAVRVKAFAATNLTFSDVTVHGKGQESFGRIVYATLQFVSNLLVFLKNFNSGFTNLGCTAFVQVDFREFSSCGSTHQRFQNSQRYCYYRQCDVKLDFSRLYCQRDCVVEWRNWKYWWSRSEFLFHAN